MRYGTLPVTGSFSTKGSLRLCDSLQAFGSLQEYGCVFSLLLVSSQPPSDRRRLQEKIRSFILKPR